MPQCTQTTREGKPFCPDHVEKNAYVQNVLNTLAEREEEEEKVRRRGSRAVNPEGITAREIVLHLSLHGARTLERLSREMNMDARVLDGYVGAMVRRGVISLGRTNRGSTVVKLTKVRRDDDAIIDADEEPQAAEPKKNKKHKETAA